MSHDMSRGYSAYKKLHTGYPVSLNLMRARLLVFLLLYPGHVSGWRSQGKPIPWVNHRLRERIPNTPPKTFDVPTRALGVLANNNPWHIKSTVGHFEELHYEQQDKDMNHVTDQFTLQVPSQSSLTAPLDDSQGNLSKDASISLHILDLSEGVWVEESFMKEQHVVCPARGACTSSVTLQRPLVGYDLLRSAACGGEMKKQPFTEGRWGFIKEEQEMPCYLVSTTDGGRMFPEKCAVQETVQETAQETVQETDKNPQWAALNDNSVSLQAFRPIQTMPTHGTTVEHFAKSRQPGLRKFVCRVSYHHYGYPLNLRHEPPSSTVSVFYKPHDAAQWGTLLNLSWDQFARGLNRYRSWVAPQHLNNQGVEWSGCFKCVAHVNGVSHSKCLGPCNCE